MEHSDTQQGTPKGLQQLGYGPQFKERVCDMLENIRLLSDLERRDIEVLADYTGAYLAPPKTIIFHEGQRDPFLCLVVDGRLDVIKEQNATTKRKLVTVRAGKVIGEMSLIDELPHSATVVATEESTLLLLTRRGLEGLEESHPRLAYRLVWKLAQQLSHRLRQTSGLLIDHL